MLHGYYPIHIRVIEGHVFFCLSKIDRESFKKPFLPNIYSEETNKSKFKWISLLSLEEEVLKISEVALVGIIYHISRCGSTMVSQSIACLDEVRVISEPKVLGMVRMKQLDNEFDEVTLIRILKVTLSLFGQMEEGITGYLLKCSSTSSSLYPFFNKVLKEYQSILVIRDPLEVIVSLLKRPSIKISDFTLNPERSQIRLGVSKAKFEGLNQEEYIALFLSNILTTFLSNPDSNRIVIDYKTLKKDLIRKVLPHLGVVVSEVRLTKISDRLESHSKYPRKKFEVDSEEKQLAVTSKISLAVDKYIKTSYKDLLNLAAK